jgi:hypothetical protein
VLASLSIRFEAGIAIDILTVIVAILTLLSVVFYVAAWVRHMNLPNPGA